MNNTLDIEQHLKSFVESFVLEERHETWTYLLRERPDDILTRSSKLFNYLSHNHITQNDSLSNTASDDQLGIFYDFTSDPECISFKEATEKSKGHDAIFSIISGELAIYFYHEGWNFVCKR